MSWVSSLAPRSPSFNDRKGSKAVATRAKPEGPLLTQSGNCGLKDKK